jgi:hypothetical protein
MTIDATTTYFLSSWACFGFVWTAWVIRCARRYVAGTLFSRKMLQSTGIPVLVTVFALFPPHSWLMSFLYVLIALIAVVYDWRTSL